MATSTGVLADIGDLIAAHAKPDMTTPIGGLLLSTAATGPETPDYELTDPLLVVMARGGKRLLLGDQVHEYRSGQYLLVTASLPVTGHFFDTTPTEPALAMGLVLRPALVAELALQDPRRSGGTPPMPAMTTGDASPELLDAVRRLLRLLDHPADAPVLAPLVEREILWRVLTGPHGQTLRQIGLVDGDLSHVSRAIGWLRQNYAEPMRVEDLARTCGMSTSAFHRNFRAVTAMSPLQFQKRIRLQEARSHVASRPADIAAIGHLVGYDSPSQFSREYRRLFGVPPGQDAQRIREHADPGARSTP